MTMQTGENEHAMRKILDMTRLISIVILAVHFYYYCYLAFQQWGFTSAFSDQILGNIYKTGLFGNLHKSSLIHTKTLMENMTPQAFLTQNEICHNDGQLSHALNYEL